MKENVDSNVQRKRLKKTIVSTTKAEMEGRGREEGGLKKERRRKEASGDSNRK